FHKGAGEYGLLTSLMAVGSLLGALLSAQRDEPRRQLLIVGGVAFGVGCVLSALSPTYFIYGVALMFVGTATQTFTTTANGVVQITSDPAVRGRVMAIYMAIFQGGTVIGAPIVGWVADAFGPRWAMVVAAAAGFAAAGLGLVHLMGARRDAAVHCG
ncbi:MAG: MFS transporter, partial [Acidobacteriota bacterium]|nr:MFS transporter [Acidobacteriota bacterium]